MAWALAVDGLVVDSPNGLTSRYTDAVNAYMADGNNILDVDPYPTAVVFDPTNEAMVYTATWRWLTESYGTTVTVLHTDTGFYVDDSPDSNAKRGVLY